MPSGQAGGRWTESTWLRRKSIPSPVNPNPTTLMATSSPCSSNDSRHTQRYRQASASMRRTSFQFEQAVECDEDGFSVFIESGDAVAKDTAACFVGDSNLIRIRVQNSGL